MTDQCSGVTLIPTLDVDRKHAIQCNRLADVRCVYCEAPLCIVCADSCYECAAPICDDDCATAHADETGHQVNLPRPNMARLESKLDQIAEIVGKRL
jgi:hypothetical protein